MSEVIELEDKTLIDLLLEEQQSLDTPVGRFAKDAEQSRSDMGSYSDLIPLEAPGSGEQYAFQVELDRCSGCKACATACHSLNGLDTNEAWRDVGVLVGGEGGPAIQQTVTTACHHCVEPACLIGCPVNAYEKDPVSGIVLHLDDQCIGCQYCVLKCPYDVPKYSEDRGIVRKCDMCHSRLSSGEAPACVQACPHEAIKIVLVEQKDSAERAGDAQSFLPSSPNPSYTKPTTRYLGQENLPSNAIAGDAHAPRPQNPHWPLVGLLALSQLGVGGLLAVAGFSGQSTVDMAMTQLVTAWFLLHAGLLCSVTHLGQPLKAWRIFLGLRRSWLSREALVLGLCSAASSALLAATLARSAFGLELLSSSWMTALASSAAALGLLGVLTSVLIYVDTRRPDWKLSVSSGKFFGTASLGAALFGVALFGASLWSTVLFASMLCVKCMWEWRLWNADTLLRSLHRGALRRLWQLRIVAAATSALLVGMIYGGASVHLFFPALASLCLGEAMERALYFMAVRAPKMPGGLS